MRRPGCFRFARNFSVGGRGGDRRDVGEKVRAGDEAPIGGGQLSQQSGRHVRFGRGGIRPEREGPAAEGALIVMKIGMSPATVSAGPDVGE